MGHHHHVLHFEINKENEISLIVLMCSNSRLDNFPRRSVIYSIDQQSLDRVIEPCTVLLFISFVYFHQCILGANVIDLEYFKTVLVIK